jgi:hypothetical protein
MALRSLLISFITGIVKNPRDIPPSTTTDTLIIPKAPQYIRTITGKRTIPEMEETQWNTFASK